MTTEQHSHAFQEAWSIEQSEMPGMPTEFAELYCEQASIHAAAAWATESQAEVSFMPESASSDLEAIAA